MIDAMLARLAGHSMWSAPGALDRLKMCADCRVIDLINNEISVDIRESVTEPSPIAAASNRSPKKTGRARSSMRSKGACTGPPPDARPAGGARRLGPVARRRTTNPLAGAWNRLVLASRAMDAEAAEQEYTDLFVGVGKKRMRPACRLLVHDIGACSRGSPYARISRPWAWVARAGRRSTRTIWRRLCETMRILVAGGAGRLPRRRGDATCFLRTPLAPWVFACCIAIRESSVANYYGRVAEFTQLLHGGRT